LPPHHVDLPDEQPSTSEQQRTQRDARGAGDADLPIPSVATQTGRSSCGQSRVVLVGSDSDRDAIITP
jgi:hypothetical protein